MRLATILRTGMFAYDQVFKGVYGAIHPGTKEGTVIFMPAPEFRFVSHVFEHMPQIAVPADGVQVREVADQDEALAKAQLLFGLGARWNSLYAARTADMQGDVAPNIGTAALYGEMQSVARNVRNVLSNAGLQVFEVPVLVKGNVERNGTFVNSKESLVTLMGSDRTIEFDPDPLMQVRPLGVDPLSGAASEIARAAAAEQQAQLEAAPPAAADPVPARREGGVMAGFHAWLNSFVPGAFDNTDPVDDHTEQPAAQAAAPAGDVAPAAGEQVTEQPAGNAWAGFRGIEASVRAVIYVVAPDAEHAVRAVPLMVDAYKQDAAGLHLDAKSVASVRDLERDDLSLDFQEDEDHDDYDRP